MNMELILYTKKTKFITKKRSYIVQIALYSFVLLYTLNLNHKKKINSFFCYLKYNITSYQDNSFFNVENYSQGLNSRLAIGINKIKSTLLPKSDQQNF